MSARKFEIAVTVVALVAALALSVCVAGADDSKAQAEKAAAKDKSGWRPLFDGKTLSGWKTTQFGAHGQPEVKDGQLVLPAGDPLTGVTRAKDDVPHVNYD